MRSNLMAIFFLSLLLVLIAGSVFLPAGAETITVGVKYDPARIDLAEPNPTYVNATISFPPSYNASNVNPATILMENTLPSTTALNYVITKFNDYYAVFDGPSVVNIIWLKLYHMGVVDPSVHKPIKVYLTITGKLYDGTDFQGTGYIAVKMYGSTPPPPPPPPGP